MPRPGLTIKIQTLVRILYGLGAVGVLLGIIGLTAAFRELPPREDHIVLAATIIMVGGALVTILYSRRLRR